MTATNVLILTSNTGGGHRSAAYALADSLVRSTPGEVLVKITQVLEEAHLVSRKLADMYNYLLRHRQDWMKYYYWGIHKARPNEWDFVFEGAFNYGQRLFERYYPNVIVSVHPMTQHFFAFVLRKLKLQDKIPLVSVVTDPCYGFWRGWACEDVREYYVATEGAKQQLMEYGIASHRIRVQGMPIHSKFQPVSLEEKRALRREMGLDPDKFTVFLNAGWVGGGNVPRIYQALIQSGLDIQAVFLAGHNQCLIQDAYDMSRSARFPVRILGYSEEIERLMNVSDVMVSKSGGLSTFEAMACQLPILIDAVTEPMPQEANTSRFIQERGAGILLNQPEEIISVVQSFLTLPDGCEKMRKAALRIGKPGASDQIAQSILESLSLMR